MEEETKTCSKCNKTKPIHDFYKSGMGGYRPKCKACEIEQRKKYKPKRKRRGYELFYSDEVIALSKVCKSKKITYFGIFLGIMFEVREGEIFCFSSLKDSTVVSSISEGRQWLAKQVIICAAMIDDKLFKRARKMKI
jgi:hypothetical protein